MVGESTEKEPEIIFEHDCPVEELADFLSADSVDKESRIKHTPEEAKERIKSFLAKPNVVELILRSNGELAGCAFTYEQDKEGLKKYILSLYEEYKSKGIQKTSGSINKYSRKELAGQFCELLNLLQG